MLTDRPEIDEECDCAPSPREKRALWPSLSRRSAMGVGALGALALAATGGSFFLPAAFAADYPSWDDVQRAKANEALKASEVTRIQGLIQSLQNEVTRTQAEAERLSGEYYDAQQAYAEASYRADELQRQADAEAAKALDAANKAGRVAAQLYRSGGDDTSMKLFFAGSAANADDLLSRLGTMDKLLERNQDVYAQALSAQGAAKLVSGQAQVARDARDKLQQEAQQKMVASQQAADAAQAALDNQTANLATLQAQLQLLQDTTAKTVADYQAGVEAARKAKEEADRKAAEARAAAAAAAAAAAHNSGGGGGGGSSGGSGGSVGSSGWCRPTSGFESSGYGYRTSVCGPQGCASSFHAGVDLAPGCGAAIYAASTGTVVYSGGTSGYGNYIRIDHGGGVGSGYGHIMNGGLMVRAGQRVQVGQLIAYVGNTGRSFGCHLHFEIYTPNGTTNPTPFMAARGISV